MQRSRDLPSKNKRSFVTCDEKWTKRSARVAPRENASESDTMEHVALCRVIKRNVVTRTNSKRWRYWASVQGYAPCSCCLKPFTPSFLLRNSSSPPSFFLSVGHISAVFIIRLVFFFLRLYVSSLLFLSFFSLLSGNEGTANFPRVCHSHLLDWRLNSDVGNIYIRLSTDVIDAIEDLLINRDMISFVIACFVTHLPRHVFFGRCVKIAPKWPLYFLQWSHPASSIFEHIQFDNILFQICSFELVAVGPIIPAISSFFLYLNYSNYRHQIEIASITNLNNET